MGKHVLILEGSPRVGGNSDVLAEAFAAGAREVGHEVSVIKVTGYRVNGCFACDMCWTMGLPCVQSDDAGKLFPEIEMADVVVLVSPLYFFGFSSQLKALIDRLYPYYVEKSPMSLRGKECVLLIAAATDAREDLKGMEETYRIMTDYLEWRDRGVLVAYGMNVKGEVKGSVFQEEARKLGATI